MSEENVEVVRALYEAFVRRGESPFSVYDPDIEWDMSRSAIPLPGEEAVYHGHEGVTFHLKGSARADLPAVARPITEEAERREVIVGILDDLGRTPGDLDEWVAGSPLVEVEFG